MSPKVPLTTSAPALTVRGPTPAGTITANVAAGDKSSDFLTGGPVKGPSLSNAGYDGALFESTPFFRTMRAAVTGWLVPAPAAAKPLSMVLPTNDIRLTPTVDLPGREAWRDNMTKLVTSAGAVQRKPTAFYLAGPMGVGKVAAAARFYETGVFPQQVVRADPDELHNMVPEASVLLSLNDARAMDVVHEEASNIGKAAYRAALNEKRDVVHNSMFGDDASLNRIKDAKSAGFKRSTVALVSTLEVASARATANGAFADLKFLGEAHAQFARNFDKLVAESDELVLVRNTGKALEIIGHAKDGKLTVTNAASYEAFRAMGK